MYQEMSEIKSHFHFASGNINLTYRQTDLQIARRANTANRRGSWNNGGLWSPDSHPSTHYDRPIRWTAWWRLEKIAPTNRTTSGWRGRERFNKETLDSRVFCSLTVRELGRGCGGDGELRRWDGGREATGETIALFREDGMLAATTVRTR